MKCSGLDIVQMYNESSVGIWVKKLLPLVMSVYRPQYLIGLNIILPH